MAHIALLFGFSSCLLIGDGIAQTQGKLLVMARIFARDFFLDLSRSGAIFATTKSLYRFNAHVAV